MLVAPMVPMVAVAALMLMVTVLAALAASCPRHTAELSGNLRTLAYSVLLGVPCTTPTPPPPPGRTSSSE
ncbi:unnamed protein product [Lampetra fluviatilis]